jgi:hypothetical protein
MIHCGIVSGFMGRDQIDALRLGLIFDIFSGRKYQEWPDVFRVSDVLRHLLNSIL